MAPGSGKVSVLENFRPAISPPPTDWEYLRQQGLKPGAFTICTKNSVGIERFIWYGFSSSSDLAGPSPLRLTKNNETKYMKLAAVVEHDSATILHLQEFGPSKLRIVKIELFTYLCSYDSDTQ